MKQTEKIGVFLLGTAGIVLSSYGVYHLSQPKAQAKIVLTRFLDACADGDREKVCRYSVVEEMLPAYNDMVIADGEAQERDPEAEINDYVQNLADLEKFEIGDGGNAAENYTQSAANIRKNAENYAKILEPEQAEAESEEQFLSFLDAVEDAYAFDVRIRTEGEWSEADDGSQIPVVKIGGVWKVDPFSPAILIPTIRDPDEDTEENVKTEEIGENFEEESEP